MYTVWRSAFSAFYNIFRDFKPLLCLCVLNRLGSSSQEITSQTAEILLLQLKTIWFKYSCCLTIQSNSIQHLILFAVTFEKTHKGEVKLKIEQFVVFYIRSNTQLNLEYILKSCWWIYWVIESFTSLFETFISFLEYTIWRPAFASYFQYFEISSHAALTYSVLNRLLMLIFPGSNKSNCCNISRGYKLFWLTYFDFWIETFLTYNSFRCPFPEDSQKGSANRATGESIIHVPTCYHMWTVLN